VEAQALIDSYVEDVAARLPRRLRNDVALELRTLLTEQLNAAAKDAGRAPSGELAMQVLAQFGRPEEVAPRYRSDGFHIIEPELAPAFVKSAIACVAIQWAFTLPYVFLTPMTFGEWVLGWGLGALWWVGLLVVWFAGAAWIRRRSPVDPHGFSRPWTHWILWLPVPRDWRPGHRPASRVDPEVAARRAAPTLLPLAAVVTIFFIAPAWFLDHFLPDGTNASWALYDENFRRGLLLPLIALMALRVSLFAAAVLKRGWWAPTEGIRFVLWVGFVGLLYWAAFGWHVFAAAGAELLFKAWLLIFLLVNTIQIGVWIFRALARIGMPKGGPRQA